MFDFGIRVWAGLGLVGFGFRLSLALRFHARQKCEIRDPQRCMGNMPQCTYREKKKFGVDRPIQFQKLFE
jgi:hypothetical protein